MTGVSTSSAEQGYQEYIGRFASSPRPEGEIIITQDQLDAGKSTGTSLVSDGIMTAEESGAVFGFDVMTAGLYQMQISYTTIPGKGASIERRILLDGHVPYSELESVSLRRTFADAETDNTYDKRHNQKRPAQSEVFGPYEQFVSDNRGYIDEPLQLYLEEGRHEIAFLSIREPVILRSVIFCRAGTAPAYQDVYNDYIAKGYEPAEGGHSLILEAEKSASKSGSTLYPLNDRTSSLTSPASDTKIVLNTIGGINWRYPHQEISWTASVPVTGLYEIGIRFKQNYTDGQNSVRTLYINGEVPFQEARNIIFVYSNDWQLKVIGEESPYLFYFEKNKKYTLTFENTLGGISGILDRSAAVVSDLNEIYRLLKVVIGNIPDPNRDYNIDEVLPEAIDMLGVQKVNLEELATEIETLTDGKGNGYAAYQRLFIQIGSFLADTDTIPTRMNSFSTNISSLADYIYNASEQPLLLDYFIVQPPDRGYPRAKDNLLERISYEFSSFLSSFFADYNLISSGEMYPSTIDLWITTGRDQAETVKLLIDNRFSDEYRTGVNVRLVAADVILPAVAAGKGPDVAVGQEKSLPVKFGLRNALIDLSQFEDLAEVLESFESSAYASFRLDQGLYALPDSQNFLMMYVREDVMNQLGLAVPETWDQLYSTLFDLHQNNLDIGLPNITEDNLEIFYALLFQHGGTLFNEDLSRTRLDEEKAIYAFTEWSRLYTKYKITEQMNHLTRFRTGEAPLVIANLSFYNLLSLSASEIKGLWRIMPIPGVAQPDGSIDRSIGSLSTGAVIFRNSKNVGASWDFLKWWVSYETQLDYTREMENLQGVSGRIMLANKAAFEGMSWPVKDLKTIRAQRENIEDVYEIAGSYVLDRYICTALRYTIEKNADPREILLDWNKKINTENEIRRREFGY
ncbi:MAG: extracellular solute-binding protein [Saccharofermentanales bacterium]